MYTLFGLKGMNMNFQVENFPIENLIYKSLTKVYKVRR